MNTLMLAVIALVAFIYCGGSRVPPVLRQNKDMILGVLVGLVLCSFFGLRLEGLDGDVVRVTAESCEHGGKDCHTFYVDRGAGGLDAADGGAAIDSGWLS
jgi:hypothetical protein